MLPNRNCTCRVNIVNEKMIFFFKEEFFSSLINFILNDINIFIFIKIFKNVQFFFEIIIPSSKKIFTS